MADKNNTTEPKKEKKTLDVQAVTEEVSPQEMKKNIRDLIIITTGVFIGLVMLIILLISMQEETQQNTYDIMQGTPPIQVTATQLMTAYAQDSVEADAEYRFRKLTITGRILYIGKDPMGDPFVLLADERKWAILPVMGMFGGNADLSSFERGQIVELTGECDSQTFVVKIWANKLEPSNKTLEEIKV